MSFSGKVCLVTGGAGGLGKATANAFLSAGACVSICDVHPGRLAEVEKELGDAYVGKVLATQADVTDEAAIQQVHEKTVAKFGRLDVLVNNAGIMDKWDPVATCERSIWDRCIAINLTAPYLFSKLAVNQMLEQERPGGVIINISSCAAAKGSLAGAAYTASKTGLIGLTKNTASFYNKKGVRCVAFLPGGMITPGMMEEMKSGGQNPEGYDITQKSRATEPNMVDVNDAAQTVLFYSSDHARGSNGAIVSVDGGWLAF